MKLIDQRYLAGANLYSTKPAVLGILDVGDVAAPQGEGVRATARRVSGWLGGLRQVRSLVGLRGNVGERSADGLAMAQLVQCVALKLQRLAGSEPIFAFVSGVPQMPSRYRLVLPCRMQKMAAVALEAAVELIDAARAGKAYRVDAALARLRAASERRVATSPSRSAPCRRSARPSRRAPQHPAASTAVPPLQAS
ncbi:cyanophycin synthetase family protein [Pseudoduganella namucuonensis]|uniref:Cyanophycin synthase-like N-terminal domain-containing protein n=1 Tax=Pseudoduganella namucuonensis TaxID=1035707 RepID=A0A1I7K6P8_9BURK|nr:hypothetical protein [Pseudoduganella namucuonensis]SFU93089.1 hypothetical protein SAMN05216552_101538 [Pseudoduganella namucuonensis]